LAAPYLSLRVLELRIDPEANKWYQSESLSQFPKSKQAMTDDSSIPLSGSTAGKTPLGSGGSNGNGDSGQRVVREIGVRPANWPLLTKMNYTEWALIMKIKLHARNLWEDIKPGDVTLQEDRMALDAITSAVL
jgi:hypothetical protein